MRTIARPLSVLYFTNSHARGGAEEHLLSLIRRLDRASFTPILACPSALARQIAKDLDPGAELFPIELRSPFDLRSALRLASYVRARQIDILHSHLFCSSALASPIGRLAGVPAIFETPHVNEMWRRGWLKGHFAPDRLVGHWVDSYIAVSQANARFLIERKGLPPGKIRIIANGIDPARFEPDQRLGCSLRGSLGLLATDPVIVCVARLEPQKGHGILLDALVRVREAVPRVRLVIVGEGSLRDPLERQSRLFGLGDVVRFVGWQSNIADWLALAQMVVLPSFYEGLPLAALEALAAEKPLVATAVDGTPEVVRDNETGLAVPPGDPASLAKAILRILRDPALAKGLAHAGRQLVIEKFTLERQIRETENLYREIWEKRTTRVAFAPLDRLAKSSLRRNEAR